MEPVSCEEVPEGPQWISQVKWDGVRVMVYQGADGVRLWNRRGRDRTRHYPELCATPGYLRADSALLDGEVVAFGPDGKPSFYQVMRRDGMRRLEGTPCFKLEVPVVYMVFDILYWDGRWVVDWPLAQRIELLNRVVEPNDAVQRVASHQEGRLLFYAVGQQGLEGVVSKRLDSPYLIGQKRDVWRKIKHWADIYAVIGGYTVNDAGQANAVLLGHIDAAGRLNYVGHAGRGRLSADAWRALTKALTATRQCPFAEVPRRILGARWVVPETVVRVRYSGWTPAGHLRQPLLEAVVDLTPSRPGCPG
ncbi:MAG: DNA ligase [Alicyclobacillaceae bacterium]|nr:DNA ligase [Alicyclobacillaceae bacterium]